MKKAEYKMQIKNNYTESELLKLEKMILHYFKSHDWVINNSEENSRKYNFDEKEYDDLLSEYNSNKVEFLNREKLIYRNKFQQIIKGVEFVPDNEIFKSIVNNILFFSKSHSLDLRLHYNIFRSNVIGNLTIKNSLTIYILDGFALIRICPSRTGIEIASILVHPNYKNKKLGYVLMCILFRCILISKKEIPPIYLECTGNISCYNQMFFYPLKKQAAFFRKFGFRVTLSKEKNNQLGYIKMEFQIDKLDMNSLIDEFPNYMIHNENKCQNLISELKERLDIAA